MLRILTFLTLVTCGAECVEECVNVASGGAASHSPSLLQVAKTQTLGRARQGCKVTTRVCGDIMARPPCLHDY